MRPILIAAFLLCNTAWGQPATDLPEFEVASVKSSPQSVGGPSMVGVVGGPGTADPSRIEYRMPMAYLLMTAYRITYSQLSGPDWITSEMYDIVAKVPPGTTKEQCSLMLRRLLSERVQSQTHRVMKDLPMFTLTVAKNGPNLKPHIDAPRPMAAGGPQANVPGSPKIDRDGYPILAPGHYSANAGGHNRLQIENKNLAWLVEELSARLGRPVKDETGIEGQYDFALQWLDKSLLVTAGPDSGPDLIAAVQEQLGLKLEERRGPVEVVTIDHIDKTPAGN